MAKVILVLLLLLASDLQAANVQASALNKQPVVMLTEFEPWTMSLGRTTPLFILYTDGQVIFWRNAKGPLPGEYLTLKLTSRQMKKFIRALHPEQINALDKDYTSFELSNQPTNILELHTDKAPNKKIFLHGQLSSLRKDGATLPQSLVADMQLLNTYKNKVAVPWMPTEFEVVMMPFESAQGEPVYWPSDWPGIHSTAAVDRGERFSIYLEASDLPQLRNLIGRITPNQPVIIDGRKWSCSVRFPFPHEEP